MYQRIRSWLAGKLFKLVEPLVLEAIADTNELNRQELLAVRADNSNLRERTKQLEDTVRMLSAHFKIGIDHHLRDRSWAVICTVNDRGKEQVSFYDIGMADVDSLRSLLQTLRRENVIVDAHPNIEKYLMQF